MSLILTGDASHITTPLSATITGIALTGGLWRFTTSAAHHYGNGDTVRLNFTASAVVYDFLGTIAVVDATHFDLTSPSSGTFTGGTGTATDLSLTPPVQVPTDGDTFSLQLSGMLSALQACLDRTQALKLMMVSPTLVVVDVLATAIVPIPGFTKFVIAEGCGGGGGGGGGGGSRNNANVSAVSGAGGGGARLHRVTFAPTVDHVVTVTIGAGGAHGGAGTGSATAPTAGFGGVDGGDSTIVDTTASATLAIFRGAQGGGGGPPAAISSFGRHAAGGRSVRMLTAGTWGNPTLLTPGVWTATGDGYGGDGIDSPENLANGLVNAGWDSSAGTQVGAINIIGGGAGTPGATSGGNVYGGGGGGGGGAGVYSNGGSGGNGGDGTSGGAGFNGDVGQAPATANSGGGGGGGGGGGAGVTPGDGGHGGDGGAGRVRLYYVLPGGLT